MPDAPAQTISIDDYLKLAETLGSVVALVDPAIALTVKGGIAAVEGAYMLLRDEVTPLVKQFQAQQMSVVEQATLAAQSAASRTRVGAPQAVIN